MRKNIFDSLPNSFIKFHQSMCPHYILKPKRDKHQIRITQKMCEQESLAETLVGNFIFRANAVRLSASVRRESSNRQDRPDKIGIYKQFIETGIKSRYKVEIEIK